MRKTLQKNTKKWYCPACFTSTEKSINYWKKKMGLRSFPVDHVEEIQAILVLEKLLQSVKNHQDPDLAPQPNTYYKIKNKTKSK